MPANFTQEQRQMIQEKLIAVGYDLIREVGLKKMKVSMIAERADIATGTFFHFYNPPFCERHQCAMKRLGKLSLF